jgi:limonene-1,2-epoxide hydrolase
MSKLYEYIESDEYRAFVHAAELADEAVSKVSVAITHGYYDTAAQLATEAAIACANAATAAIAADEVYANRY